MTESNNSIKKLELNKEKLIEKYLLCIKKECIS
jgi:hypothetical protein